MSTNHTIKSVQRDGQDLVLKTTANTSGSEQEFVIKNASIEPKEGGFMYFPSSTATAQADGSHRGGDGFIAMDGNEFPYRRVAYGEFIEGW